MRMQRRWAITHDGGVLHPRQPTIHWLTCKNCANINTDQAATKIRRHFQDIDRSENKIDSLDEKIEELEHRLQELKDKRKDELDRLR